MKRYLILILLTCVPSLRARETVVEKPQTTNPSSYTIVIDPGHGGPYIGAASPSQRVVEKNGVLELALLLAEQLRNKGYTVVLTRTGDYALDPKDLISDLKKRAQVTRDVKADILVSLHLNSSPSKSARGFMLFVPYEDKYPLKSYALASALHYDMSHEIQPEFGGGTLGNVNHLDAGIRASKFNVLMHSFCPAVLVELAYLSHPETEQQLLTKEYKEHLVKALYSGIRRYLIHEKGAHD